MRRLSLSLALAISFAGCSSAHELDSGVAPSLDAGADAGDPVFAMLTDAQLTTCVCHHGCGPGLDGTFTFSLTSSSTVPHTITVTRVTIDSIGSPGGPYTTPDQGHFSVAGAAADGSVSLPPGATTTLVVTVYLDIPVVEPGTDSVRIEARLDLGTVAFELMTVPVTTAPGC